MRAALFSCRLTHKAVLAVALVVLAPGVFSVQAFAKTVITVATYGDIITQKDTWEDIKKTFEAQNPGYELSYTVIPYNDYITKLTTMFATGKYPDVFQTWAQYKPRWADDGVLLDVTSFVNNSKRLNMNDYFPVAWDAAKYKGKYYGTPHDFNSEVYYFNVDMAEDAGLPVPSLDWDWRDFERYVTKMSRPDEGIFGTNHSLQWGGGLQWVYNFSGHYWLTDNNTKAAVSDPKVVDMIKFWVKLTFDLKAAPSVLKPGQPGKDEFGGYFGVWQGWVAYLDQLSGFERNARAAGKDFWEWTMLPYPAGPAAQHNFAQGHMWSIYSKHPDPEKAWVLAEWLASYEGQKVWARNHAFQPLMPKAELWESYLSFLPKEKYQKTAAFLLGYLYPKYALNFSYWPTYPEIQQVWTQAMADIFFNQKSPDTVLQNANARMEAILLRRGVK